MKKQWKAVPGYEDYLVSSFGEVKSYKRYPEGKLLKPKMLKQSGTNNQKYFAVRLYDEFGNFKTCTIHSLVMKAFVGERPANMIIDHIFPDTKLNRLDNLRYVTQKINVQKEQADDILCTHVSGKSFFVKGTREGQAQTGVNRVTLRRLMDQGRSLHGWSFKLIRRHER